ncbi:MAG: alcohol dehydrogenase catalytic domain-containing protein [Syntrophorhabdaceae bacterium]|nr:alcohol dehydrogenase catalytic domain-containing protein [Syntrophorhabdaceae bacterium]
MLVGMYYNNKKVELEEMPVPEVGPHDILIKVMASGICGSDVLEWYRIKKAPLVLGHEVTGEVVEVGSSISNFKKGDRVFTTHHVPCGQCYWCQKGHETACDFFQTKNNFTPGGFSEYLRVSGKSVETGTLVLPETVSYEEGSFVEPLGTVVRGIDAIGLKKGDTVIVLGCGIAGLLMIKLCLSLGAGKVFATDIYNNRLEAAKRLGAEPIHAGEDIEGILRSKNNDRLADKVIVCAGALSAAQQSLKLVERGGTILFFAVPNPGDLVEIDFSPLWRNDVTIKTCYGAAPIDNIKALALIEKNIVKVTDLITHRLSLRDIGRGFEIVAKGDDCLKVIIKPFE